MWTSSEVSISSLQAAIPRSSAVPVIIECSIYRDLDTLARFPGWGLHKQTNIYDSLFAITHIKYLLKKRVANYFILEWSPSVSVLELIPGVNNFSKEIYSHQLVIALAFFIGGGGVGGASLKVDASPSFTFGYTNAYVWCILLGLRTPKTLTTLPLKCKYVHFYCLCVHRTTAEWVVHSMNPNQTPRSSRLIYLALICFIRPVCPDT